MDEHTISPAGDPFYAAAPHPDDTPHGCYEGVVYIGCMVSDPETGGETEVIEAVPCRRCVNR